ncbi:MAG: hypothetical protein JXB10_00020 [Pirellulales bacterium]|nr:hypothetical protein [Pirellulales bacterium]
MELKNALAVCLISLFSATLVVLIARSLDNQAAAQLEPQLTQIADELRAIRRQGGIARSDDVPKSASVGDGLIVYYFHSDARCPNCRAIEAGTKEVLDTHFAEQQRREEIEWKVLNFSKPSGAVLALKFEVKDPVVVLARVKDNEVQDGWQRLDKVMALADDKTALMEYVRSEIERMLATEKQPMSTTPRTPEPTTSSSDVDMEPSADPPAIPIP